MSENRKWKWESSFTVGDLHRRLISDMTVIRNICDNSNPTYKTRIAQIKAIVAKLEEDLSHKAGQAEQGQ